ncbi:MAG: 50S ribosomal protein L5 [Candidatus Korarchaeota archaeon]|nr:50S ribosomal protein L5 [Thermoproteota archaeon]
MSKRARRVEEKKEVTLAKSLSEITEAIIKKYKDRYPNPNLIPRLEKVVINYSCGPDESKLERAKTILEGFFGKKLALVRAKKTIHTWGIRRGKTHGWKLTLRGEEAYQWLKRLMKVIDYTVYEEQIDKYGNFSFGVKEHIEIPGVKYIPELGTIGFDVCVTFCRNGYRVMRRRLKTSKIPLRHRLTREDVIIFLREMGVTVKPGARPEEE